MGMYTELVLSVRLRPDPALHGPLAWAMGTPDAPRPEGHGFWTIDRSEGLLSGGGLATNGAPPTLRPANRHLPPDHPDFLLELTVWTVVKNYEVVIESFLYWLEAFVQLEQDTRTCVGFTRYEENEFPQLIFFDPATRTLDTVSVRPS